MDSVLSAFYPFDGNALDASGNLHHGSVYGATLTTDRHSNSNSAYSFDGVNDSIVIKRWDSLCPTDEVSISFWTKANQYKSQFAFSLSPENSQYGRMAIQVNYKHSSIPATFWDYANASNGRMQILNDPYVSSWEHYVFTASMTTGTLKMYRDGRLVKSQAIGSSLMGKSRSLWIGGLDNSNFSHYFSFNGKIDDVRIYNREIDSCEVKVLNDGDTSKPVISKSGLILSSSPSNIYKWYRNDTLISGSTNSSHLITQSGYYYVVVPIVDGCYMKKSDTINVVLDEDSSTSIKKIQDELALSISPNPAKDKLTLSFSNEKEIVRIEIYNSNGQIVFNTRAKSDIIIDVREMAPGLYILKAKSDSGLFSQEKFLIE